MKHKIVKVDDKSKDWKVVSIEMPDENVLTNVSVNRTNKKGEVFPNFDGIVADSLIDGELWKSDADKWYLFAPKPTAFVKGPGGYKPIAQAMETKNENIKEAQERKNEAIHRAGAFRDATLFTVEIMKQAPFPTDEELKAEWRKWVKFFLGAADEPFV